MKFTLKTKDCKDSRILLDDKDISDRVTGVKMNIKGGCVPTVTLELRPDDIEVDGDFDIFKDVPKLCCTGDYGNIEKVQPPNNIEWIERLSEKIIEKCSRSVSSNNSIMLTIDKEVLGKIIVNNLQKKV